MSSRSQAARRHMNKVALLSCVVCRNLGYGETPAECHHVRDRQGMGSRNGDFATIPLCHPHHRTGRAGIAFHATGREEWEAKYGTQADLLKQTLKEVTLCL